MHTFFFPSSVKPNVCLKSRTRYGAMVRYGFTQVVPSGRRSVVHFSPIRCLNIMVMFTHHMHISGIWYMYYVIKGVPKKLHFEKSKVSFEREPFVTKGSNSQGLMYS